MSDSINIAFQNLYRQIVEKISLDNVYADEKIPRVPLGHANIKNCKVLLNRRDLLLQMPQNSICAELGVDRGEFTQQIIDINRPNKVHLVDTWGDERYNQTLYESILTKFQKEISMSKIVIHRELSVEAVNYFKDDYFDWVYIDTDHSFETTFNELVFYSKKIKKGGFIAGHDYTMGNWKNNYRYGVIEAVHKFCVEFNWEIIFLTAETIEDRSFALRQIT